VPRNGDPGRWVETQGALEAGSNGVHALRTRRLVDWIDDELWVVELAGEVEEVDDVLVARRGRLLRKVDAWDDGTMRDFRESCIWRARDLAVESLERAGRGREAAALQDADALDSLQAVAVVEAERAAGAVEDALVYLADAVQVSRGGWFEKYVGHPGASATPTPGAIAANIGFVVAMSAGGVAADAAEDPSAFDDGWDAERGRQLGWLRERLELDEL
jgi:hypothetical protein